MRLKGEEIWKPVLPAKQVGDYKDDGGEQSDLEIGNDVAGLSVDDEMIAQAAQPGHAHDNGDVEQQDRAAKGYSGKRRPSPQESIYTEWGCQRIGLLNSHELYQYGCRCFAFPAQRAGMAQPDQAIRNIARSVPDSRRWGAISATIRSWACAEMQHG